MNARMERQGNQSMTNEQLMRQYQTDPARADDALSQLCEQNMGLVWDLAIKCAADFGIGAGNSRFEDTKEELSSEGFVAMLEAIRSGNYDENKGMFTTYVYPFIKGAMYRWLEKNVSAVEVSRHSMAIIQKVRQMYYDYGTPAPEIARVLKISEAEVAKHLAWNTDPVTIDDLESEKVMPDIENLINIDGIMLHRNSMEAVEHRVMAKIWLEKLPEVFDKLRIRDKFILGHFYGIYGYEYKSKAQLALELELSIDGVYKARDVAVEHAKVFYYGSELHTWRRAYVDTKVTANRGLK